MWGEGNGTPLQHSCLENPMDRGAWKAAVYGVIKSRTRLSHFTFTFRFHALEKEMATHSSVLARRIPGMGEPGGLPSMGSHRVGHDWSNLAAAAAASVKWCDISLCFWLHFSNAQRKLLSIFACAGRLHVCLHEVAQLCPTLCDLIDCSPPGSAVCGILQARMLEWVAISFSKGSSRPRDWTQVSCIAGRCFNLWATREALVFFEEMSIQVACPCFLLFSGLSFYCLL